jgi:hypothetical protein
MPKFKEFYNTFLKESPDTFKHQGESIHWKQAGNGITFTLWNDHGVYGNTSDGIFHGHTTEIFTGELPHSNYPDAKWWNGEPTKDVKEALRQISHGSKDGLSIHRAMDGKVLAGRVFPKYKTISFWNTAEEGLRDVKMLESFLKDIGVEMTDYAYDFINKKDPIQFGQNGAATNDGDLSKEEIDELMQVQHFDPIAKKKLRQNAGYIKSKLPLGYSVFSRNSD